MVVSLLVNGLGDVERSIIIAENYIETLSDARHICHDLRARFSHPTLQAGLKGAWLGTEGITSTSEAGRSMVGIVKESSELFFDEKNCYYMTDMYERIREPQHRTYRM